MFTLAMPKLIDTVFLADVADWLAGVFRAPLRLEAIAAYRASDGNRLLDAIAVELGARQGIARAIWQTLIDNGQGIAAFLRQLARLGGAGRLDHAIGTFARQLLGQRGAQHGIVIHQQNTLGAWHVTLKFGRVRLA